MVLPQTRSQDAEGFLLSFYAVELRQRCLDLACLYRRGRAGVGDQGFKWAQGDLWRGAGIAHQLQPGVGARRGGGVVTTRIGGAPYRRPHEAAVIYTMFRK